MSTDWQWEPDWPERTLQAMDVYFEDHLGPRIADAARLEAPVDTGRLKASISHEVDSENHELRIVAHTGYAAAVNNGHRIVVHGHDTGEIQPPNPFMLRALYRNYGGE